MNTIFRVFIVAITLIPAGFIFGANYIFSNVSSWTALICLGVLIIGIAMAGYSAAYFLVWFSQFLAKRQLVPSTDKTIERADTKYLPLYLGYFFVALATDNILIFIFTFFIISFFIYFSQASYYNPVFSLIGYSHYELENKSRGLKILLISKKTINELRSQKIYARRIDDFTFLDKGDDYKNKGEEE